MIATEAIINEFRAFCCWTLCVDGLDTPCSIDGMLRCDFSDDGLIQTAEIVYDAMMLSIRYEAVRLGLILTNDPISIFSWQILLY